MLLLFALDSQAFPGFTSDCSPGNPLGGSHLNANSKGMLSSYGIQLKIGSNVITEGGITTISSERSLPISLVSTSGRSFRGFQIRVSNPGIKDTSTYLAVARDTAVQIDKYCTVIGVGGLSHNSKRDKQTVEGMFTPPPYQVDSFKFEVVIVVRNGPSVWYRSEYSVNFKVSVPSASPIALAPSTKPADKPTVAPSTRKPTLMPSTQFPNAPKPTAAPITTKLTIMPSTQFPTTTNSSTLAPKHTTAPSTTKVMTMPPTQFPTRTNSPTLAPKPTAAPSLTNAIIEPLTQFPTKTSSPTIAPFIYIVPPVSSDDDPEMDDNEEDCDDDGENNDDSEMNDKEEESDNNGKSNDDSEMDDNEKESDDDGEQHDNSEMDNNEKESADDGKNNDDGDDKGDDAKHKKKNVNFHWSIGDPWA